MKLFSYLKWVMILGLASSFVGCETVKGIGKDITGASTMVQDSFSGSGRKR